MRHVRSTAKNGENDGHRSTQPHPRYKQTVAKGIAAEWRQRHKHGKWPRYEYHHQTDDQPRNPHRTQFRRIDEQAQREEHGELCNPRHTVEKTSCGTLVDKAAVADHQPRHINGKITVAMQIIGGGKNEETARQYQDGIKRLVVHVDSIDNPNQAFAETPTCHGSNEELKQQYQQGVSVMRFPALQYKCDERSCQHVSHGVVGSAFQLQCRP